MNDPKRSASYRLQSSHSPPLPASFPSAPIIRRASCPSYSIRLLAVFDVSTRSMPPSVLALYRDPCPGLVAALKWVVQQHRGG